MARPSSEEKALPTKRRKRRSAQEINARILTAAGEEFGRYGFSGATTAAIARRADVTEAQLFRGFASKAELFRESVFRNLNHHFSTFNAAHLGEATSEEAQRDNSRLYIRELQDFIGAHSDQLLSPFVAQKFSDNKVDMIGEFDSLTTYFERGAQIMTATRAKSPHVDPRLLVRVSFIAVMANVIFKDLLFTDGTFSPDIIRDGITDFILDGVSPGLTATQLA